MTYPGATFNTAKEGSMEYSIGHDFLMLRQLIVSRLDASRCHLCYELRYPLTRKVSRVCLVETINREIGGCLERKCRASKGHGTCEASRHAF